MTTQSRMQQIDTLANYPMGTKPDSFRLIKKTFKSGEPMKTKIGIKEQMDTITNRYNKWLYLFHISSC